MNTLTTLPYQSQAVRIVRVGDESWFVLKDVCDVLGLSNPTAVAARLEDDERAKFGLGRQGEAVIVNESGLYNVILRSEKPEARAFKRWITHEVLPALRRNGQYQMPVDTQARVLALETELGQRAQREAVQRRLLAMATNQPLDWRKWTQRKIEAIARLRNPYNSVAIVEKQLMNEMLRRCGIDIRRRMVGKALRRMEQGCSREESINLRIADVLTGNKAAIECFVKLVQEMAIQYQVTD